jgi:hypothetical protein
MAAMNPEVSFFASDFNRHFIEAAKRRIKLKNLTFCVADLYKVSQQEFFKKSDSIYLGSTLSWIDWWDSALDALIKKNIKQVSFDALAWDWNMESEVIHYKYGKKNKDFIKYNVYSVNRICSYFRAKGFLIQKTKKFEIDINLKPIDKSNLGSYTIKTIHNPNLIFSAWQHLPRVFFYFSR